MSDQPWEEQSEWTPPWEYASHWEPEYTPTGQYVIEFAGVGDLVNRIENLLRGLKFRRGSDRGTYIDGDAIAHVEPKRDFVRSAFSKEILLTYENQRQFTYFYVVGGWERTREIETLCNSAFADVSLRTSRLVPLIDIDDLT